MFDSRETNTRSFFSSRGRSLWRLFLLTTVLVLSFSEISKASEYSNEPQPHSPLPQHGPDYSDLLAPFSQGGYGFDLESLLGSVSPSELVLNGGLNPNALASALFDLVKYMKNSVDPRSESEILSQIPRYKRVEMFGTWVNEDAPVNCYNTRAEVLIRDAKPGAKISFAPANPCLVAKGEWADPYSANTYKLANAVQVDHVVPLKNAYRSGAHAWSQERRCHYANYLVDSQHLLAVSGHENMVKSDSGPENYLPPNPDYVCSYIANWMRIKAVWSLGYTANEKNAIEAALQSNNCAVGETRISLQDIQKSRSLTQRMNVKCVSPNAR